MVMFVSPLISPISRSVRSKLVNIRQMSAVVNADCVKSLLYKEYGDPVEVLQVTTQAVEQPAGNQVIVARQFASFCEFLSLIQVNFL